MELHLQRTYHKEGTNGILMLDDDQLCYTIELPWRDNRSNVSCIPEGRYGLEMRWSPRFNNHLHVERVPDRTLILFHPANNAMRQLGGCIAPVSVLTGPGMGEDSEAACALVFKLVYTAIHARERVRLIIYSQ